MEIDVVIVGAGVAGLSAAIASAEAGARTVVLEKAPNISHTNTSRSGGNLTIATIKKEGLETEAFLSPQEKAEEALNFSNGKVDSALVLAWAQNIDSTLEWLTGLGLKWEGSTFVRRNVLRRTILGKGAGLNRQMLSIARSKGITVMFNTRGIRFLNDDRGRVVGITGQTEEGLKDFPSKALVMATAGFQANQEMLVRYCGPDFAYNVKLTGSPFSTGDGHIMVEEVGAQLVNMEQFHGRSIGKHWHPGSVAPPPIHSFNFFHYSILVNKRGRRFVDESLPNDSVNCSIVLQPGQEAAFIFDEGIKNLEPQEVEQHRPPGLIVKFSTLEELSRKIGISYQELQKTIEEFNKAVAQGQSTNLDVPKMEDAVKIETPPFYVIYPVWFGLNCTIGGPRVTPKAQVVNKENIPIPGLFACGEMVGGFFGGNFYNTPGGAKYYRGNYGATTSALANCVVFGRIAGTEAAKMREQTEA